MTKIKIKIYPVEVIQYNVVGAEHHSVTTLQHLCRGVDTPYEALNLIKPALKAAGYRFDRRYFVGYYYAKKRRLEVYKHICGMRVPVIGLRFPGAAMGPAETVPACIVFDYAEA